MAIEWYGNGDWNIDWFSYDNSWIQLFCFDEAIWIIQLDINHCSHYNTFGRQGQFGVIMILSRVYKVNMERL